MTLQSKREYMEFRSAVLSFRDDCEEKIILLQRKLINGSWGKGEFINMGKRLNLPVETTNTKGECQRNDGINNTGYRVVAKEIWQQDQIGHIDDNIGRRIMQVIYKTRNFSLSSAFFNSSLIKILSMPFTYESLKSFYASLQSIDGTRRQGDQLWSWVTAVSIVIMGLLSILFL